MPRILVVDDEPAIRDLVGATLAIGSHTIVAAATGREALERLREEPADLVLLDLCLPGDLDGLDVCRRIAREPGGPKVILLTGNGEAGVRETCLAAGAAAYLTKPFSPLELITLVELILESCDVR